MELLYQPRIAGYPLEYLLSRIRGRRSRLIGNWKPLVYEAGPIEYLSSGRYAGFVRERSPEGIWRDLLREYRWVHAQMDAPLRNIFEPYFFYAELRTIFICLRHLHAGERDKAEGVLDASLLADPFRKLLREGADAGAVVEGIGSFLRELSAPFSELADAYNAAGLRGVEQKLTNAFLTALAGMELHPVIREFFRRLIDARNILNLYKAIKWETGDEAVFLDGGGIPRKRFLELRTRGDILSVNALVRQAAGTAVQAPEATQVETALYRGIGRFLKAGRKEPLGLGLILDYLWRCSVEVMNLSMLLAGKDLEREAVVAEMV